MENRLVNLILKRLGQYFATVGGDKYGVFGLGAEGAVIGDHRPPVGEGIGVIGPETKDWFDG